CGAAEVTVRRTAWPRGVPACEPARMQTQGTEDLAAEFAAERRRLVGVAYRILGSLDEAEDAVQDAWFRLARTERSTITDLTAWLTTVTSRLCLDRLRSARVVREVYV